MQRLTLPLAMAVAALGAGCANLERSRNLADPNVSGKTLAEQVCSNCHGLDGNSVSPNFPNLAAQPKTYLTGQLEGFRKPGRSDPAGFEYMGFLLFELLKVVNARLAQLALVFITASAIIEAVNLFNYMEPLFTFTLPEYASAFEADERQPSRAVR